MKNIEDTLIEFGNYYDATRRVGHTEAMLNGVKNTGACVITHSTDAGRDLSVRTRGPIPFISLTAVADKLSGLRKPLVFDNAALTEIFWSAVFRINNLKISLKRSEDEFKMEEALRVRVEKDLYISQSTAQNLRKELEASRSLCKSILNENERLNKTLDEINKLSE